MEVWVQPRLESVVAADIYAASLPEEGRIERLDDEQTVRVAQVQREAATAGVKPAEAQVRA